MAELACRNLSTALIGLQGQGPVVSITLEVLNDRIASNAAASTSGSDDVTPKAGDDESTPKGSVLKLPRTGAAGCAPVAEHACHAACCCATAMPPALAGCSAAIYVSMALLLSWPPSMLRRVA